MEALASRMQPFFAWLVQTTWVASILICLILAAQKLLGGRLGPRWCHALWLVLLLRMVLPWTPPSPVSLLSLIPDSLRRDVSHAVTAPLAPPEYLRPVGGAPDRAEAAPTEAPESSASAKPQPRDAVPAARASTPPLVAMRRMVPLLWLMGALALGGCLFAGNFALWRVIRHEQPLLEEPTLTLFERCKSQMGVTTLVALVSSEQVKTPALFGFLRPRLLLPRPMVETANPEELRYVFLHELGHLKRHDICLGWLASLLQILHWFNPLIWLAFHRMRTDRELACDALVLTRTGQTESYQYGQTMVGLLKRLSRPRRLPTLAGILESRTQLKRRIAMISRFQDNSYHWSPAALVTILAAVCLALPGAAKDTVTATKKPASLTTTPAPAQQPIFREIRIPGQLWDAQLSPDGKSMVFPSEGKLWVIARVTDLGPDGPGAPQSVDTGGIEAHAIGVAWSADGRWIAFTGPVHTKEGEGNKRMYVVSAAGGKPREVYDAYWSGPLCAQHISLSPNGEILAFSNVDANELHIYTIPAKGGVPRRLVDTPAREPVFSPDGKLLAYVEDKDRGLRGGALWVVPAGGGTPRRVADANNAWSPVWSPDGRMIAFFDWQGGRQICIVAVNERGEPTGEKTIIDCPEENGRLGRLTGWTPDNKIGVIFQSPTTEDRLYTLSLKGGPATSVRGGENGDMPHWSPDGKRIIYSYSVSDFYAGEEEADNGWLFNGTAWVPVEGGEVTKIPVQSDTKILKIAWGAGNDISPDGKTIVFSGRTAPEQDGMHIWTLPIEGGKPTRLTDAPAPLSDAFPCWSPDGEAIAFARSRDSRGLHKADICIIPSAGGEARQLTSEPDRASFCDIAWSPDGKFLAYFSSGWPEGDTVRVIPADGGESRVITKLQRGRRRHSGLAWSPDSRRIAFNDGEVDIISIVSLEDGRVEGINPGVAITRILHVDWSRAGDKLVFGGFQGGEPEFWLMENFLPQKTGM